MFDNLDPKFMCVPLDLNQVEVKRWKDQHETLPEVKPMHFEVQALKKSFNPQPKKGKTCSPPWELQHLPMAIIQCFYCWPSAAPDAPFSGGQARVSSLGLVRNATMRKVHSVAMHR